MNGSADADADADSAPGAVELREDVPLKAGAGAGGAAWCAGGPRLILACFAALSAAITLALFTQIYYGDYEVVPHGGVASDAAACSAAGTRALKAGGRALDAAAAAALCLAVLAPHLTSLDASGSLLYWEYRQARSQPPTLAEWGAAGGEGEGEGPPRLLAALAALHAQYGALPWATVLQPAIDLAKNGFPVSKSLAAALAEAAGAGGGAAAPAVGSLRTAPELAALLETLQRNSSAELSAAWRGAQALARGAAAPGAAGAWRVFAGGPAGARVRRALALALQPPPPDPDAASARALAALQREAAGEAWPPAPRGVSTGLAVVDSVDTYVACVTGLSTAFGSGPAAAAGWSRDAPAAPLDLAPAILLDDHVCGTRFVVGGGSSVALAQALAALAGGGGAAAVERARSELLAGGALSPEGEGGTHPATVNVVQQQADALLTHADSRGGGLASRF